MKIILAILIGLMVCQIWATEQMGVMEKNCDNVGPLRVLDKEHKFDNSVIHKPLNAISAKNGEVYYTAFVSNNTLESGSTLVGRIKTDNGKTWMKYYNIVIIPEIITLSSDETTLFLAVESDGLLLLQIDTNSGGLKAKLHLKEFKATPTTRLTVSPTERTIYLSLQKDNNNGRVCQWNYITDFNFLHCKEYSGGLIPSTLSAITHHNVYIIANVPKLLPSDKEIFLFCTDFLLAEDDWSLKIGCSQGQCELRKSASFYHQGLGKIYSLVPFGKEMLFFEIYKEEGIVGRKFIWDEYERAREAVKIESQGDILFLLFKTNENSVISVYNTTDEVILASYIESPVISAITFTSEQVFSADNLREREYYVNFKRSPLTSLNAMYDFSLSSSTLVPAVDGHSYKIVHADTHSFTLHNKERGKTDKKVIISEVIENIDGMDCPKVEFDLTPLRIGKLVNNNGYEKEISLTHINSEAFPESLASIKKINHSIAAFPGSEAPDYISITESSTLKISAPYIPKETEIKFTVQSTVTHSEGDPISYLKPVSLTLSHCLVPNCKKCEIDSNGKDLGKCSFCTEQYKTSPNEDSCIDIYDQNYAKISGYISKGLLYLILLVLLSLGIFRKIPLEVFWMSVYQYQIVLLVPLLGSYIPPDVGRVMLLSDFLWIPFGFINLAKSVGIYLPQECKKGEDYQSGARLHYDCFLTNIFQFLIPLVGFLVLALVLYLVKKRKRDSEHWVFTKVITLDIFLCVMMRYFLTTFTFLTQSMLSAFSRLDVDDGYNVISMFFSLLYLLTVCFVVYVVYRIGVKKIRGTPLPREDFTREISKQLKPRGISYFFILSFLGRRVLSSIWIVSSGTFPTMLRIGVFGVIQLAWITYSCFMHYKRKSLNVMEICNGVLLLVLLLIMFICIEGYQWSGLLISFFYLFSFPFGFIGYFIAEMRDKYKPSFKRKYQINLTKDSESVDVDLLNNFSKLSSE